MTKIVEPMRETPIVDGMDVVVAGGGIAGVAAAVTAARGGANTLLIERNGFLGGVATAGLMASMGNRFFTSQGDPVVRGIASEMVERLVARGGTGSGWMSTLPPKIPFDPEVFKFVLDEMVEEAHVKVRLNTLVVDVMMDGGRLESVVVEGKSGRGAILGKVFVDATGDADVAARAGAPFNYSPPGSDSLEFRMGNVDLQRTYTYFKAHPEEYPAHADAPRSFQEFERNWVENGFFYMPHGGGRSLSLVQEAIRKGDYARERGMCVHLDLFGMDGLAWNKTVVVNTGVFQIDALNTLEISKAEMEARKMCFYAAEFLKKHFPGFENAFIIATAQDLGVRVTRWIVGESTLTREDVEKGAKFDDVIGVIARPPHSLEIPYRCMVPRNMENLLVASGKSVSTTPKGLLRGMTSCIVLGQAAGVAAAMAAKTRVVSKDVSVKELQRNLLRHGVYLGDGVRLKELGLLESCVAG